MAIGLGEMRLTLDDFWDMEPREFRAAYEGWHKRNEVVFQNQYEAARLVMLAIAQANAPKGKRYRPTDVYKFPWDRKISRDPLPMDQVLKIMSLF